MAEADLARDEIQVKQQQVRVAQLQNEARLEVEDALIAMRRAPRLISGRGGSAAAAAGIARGRAVQI